MSREVNVYENPLFRRVSGEALRPGGLELTARGLEVCAFPPGALVLDLGCGRGGSLDLLGRLGLRGVGLDKSATLLAEAGRKGKVLQGDLRRLPFVDAVFAGLLCECVLSLAPDKAEALGEMRRVSGVGARLLLSDLYVREELGPPRRSSSPRPASLDSGAGLASCAGGALGLEDLRAALGRAGFRLLRESEESSALRALAARMVFSRGSLEAFWGSLCGERASPAVWEGKKFGYVQLIAEAV
jgi:SAM-dependent methyltransferase